VILTLRISAGVYPSEKGGYDKKRCGDSEKCHCEILRFAQDDNLSFSDSLMAISTGLAGKIPSPAPKPVFYSISSIYDS